MISNKALDAETKKQKHFYNKMYSGDEYAQTQRDEQITDYNKIAAVLSEYFPNSTPLTLEIGCGRGMFQDITKQYIGIDISHNALKQSKGKPKFVASGEELPFKDNSFEFIFTLTALEHFINAGKGLKEIERILKPGGIAYVRPAWYCNSWTVAGLAFKKYSELGLKEKVSKLLIPIRSNFYYRFFTNVPRRAFRHFCYTIFKSPVRLKCKKLFPDYGDYNVPDADATYALDPHAMMLYFLSRGYKVLSEKTVNTMILADYPAVVVKKSP